ncbi:MAG: pantetheine-phosphate adenylyltransferase [Candidatus Omnitrophica bacterium]|nr:pantetheine-phosphate adenylyltransferase [Candidatus Omnitrophota bacterium]MBU2251600.1 pantetheine-phosphate adenylyltransferase [Candidatus Omnitrophota bacterium]MBU2473991.1 pantetheine-phosphate adenylyltransferase [Candidatus Omnitrophota bacterium]
MKTAVYPGTFDPITNGHIDIIKRAASIFRQVTIAVVKVASKDVLFSYSERLDLVCRATKGIKGVKVEGFNGLVVDFARRKKAKVIVRGLRMISDFEYEFQMALTNRNLSPEVETLFLMPHPEYSFISSRLIREAASLGANLKKFLPSAVLKALKEKLCQRARIG